MDKRKNKQCCFAPIAIEGKVVKSYFHKKGFVLGLALKALM